MALPGHPVPYVVARFDDFASDSCHNYIYIYIYMYIKKNICINIKVYMLYIQHVNMYVYICIDIYT